MALQQLRVRQVKAMALEYGDLGQQVEKMSTHRVEVYTVTGEELERKIVLPNGAKYMPQADNLLVFINGQKVEAGELNQYVEIDDSTIQFNDDLVPGDMITFTVVGAGSGFTVAMDNRYARRAFEHAHANLTVLSKFSEDGTGKPLYNGSPVGGGDNHTHTNLLVLGNLAEQDGNLTYKGQPIKGGGGEWVFKEVPGGVMDGVNRVFTLANPFVKGSELLFMDGVLQFADVNDNGSQENDYFINAEGQVVFHASKVPTSATVLQVTYMKA